MSSRSTHLENAAMVAVTEFAKKILDDSIYMGLENYYMECK